MPPAAGDTTSHQPPASWRNAPHQYGISRAKQQFSAVPAALPNTEGTIMFTSRKRTTDEQQGRPRGALPAFGSVVAAAMLAMASPAGAALGRPSAPAAGPGPCAAGSDGGVRPLPAHPAKGHRLVWAGTLHVTDESPATTQWATARFPPVLTDPVRADRFPGRRQHSRVHPARQRRVAGAADIRRPAAGLPGSAAR